MASQSLDSAAISKILRKAGPAFLAQIRISGMFMAYLVQAKVLLQHESQSILDQTDHGKQCDALLRHLYTVSPQQFIAFCLVLCDKQNKAELVTEDFGLRIEDLRAQPLPEEMIEMVTAPATKDTEHPPKTLRTVFGSVNEKVMKENHETLDICVPKDGSIGPKEGQKTECSEMATQNKLTEPVILSVLGHYKKDPDGIFLLGNLLSEQIKEHIPKATILHVVLEDQNKIIADGQDANFIGFIRPGGLPEKETPSPKWLNFYFKTFYPHLMKYKVSHIITHVPEFIWGAINIKGGFFPEAMILTIIHEQIDTIERHHREELEMWSMSIEVMVSLGRGIYGDVENLLCGLDKTFKSDETLCYLPSPPKHFSHGGPWKKPPSSLRPVITILAGDILTQEKQKMALPIIVSAITSVAEDLHRMRSVMKLVVRITGIPRDESDKVKESLEPYINDFISMECVEAFSFQELKKVMKGSYLCIIPLGSNTLAYGLDFMVPAGFGVPTLVPDSAPILWDVRDIISASDQIHLDKVIVEVMYARSREDEERAWKDKIKDILTDMQQAQISAIALRQAIEESFVLARNRHDFISLLKVPAKLIEPGSLPQVSDSPMGGSGSMYKTESTAVQRPFLVGKPRYYYPTGHTQGSPSMDPEVIKPVNKLNRLLRNWVLIATLIPLYPLVDTMLEQGSISYTVFEEVYQTEETNDQYTAMSNLLQLVRSRGELGINQLCKALRDPTVDFGFIADRIEGEIGTQKQK